jgi:uncharacterized protein (DUF1778 family)
MKQPAPKLKEATIGIRTTWDIKALAIRAAKADRRSVSQWIEGLILEATVKKRSTRSDVE